MSISNRGQASDADEAAQSMRKYLREQGVTEERGIPGATTAVAPAVSRFDESLDQSKAMGEFIWNLNDRLVSLINSLDKSALPPSDSVPNGCVREVDNGSLCELQSNLRAIRVAGECASKNMQVLESLLK